MNKIIQVCVFIICTLLFYTANSQTITEFPTEPQEFVKELGKYLTITKREECKITATQFADNYASGAISPLILDKVAESAGIMLKRKMRAYPYFEMYIRTVNDFIAQGKSEELFVKWSDILNKVNQAQRRGSHTDFSKYVSFTDGLITDGAIYLSKSKRWYARTNNFDLGYEETPTATFAALDLIATNGKDSIVISNTAGIYNPLDNLWEGKSGKANWSRAGFSPADVYAEFSTYNIDVSKPDFTIDSVAFYDKLYFDFPLLGSFTDKLTVQKNEISYPRFNSIRKDLKIENLTENVNYIGGFSLHGTKVIGSGDRYSKATLIFYNDAGTKILKAKSDEILLRKTESLSARKAEISLYLGKDSIYHPGLNVIYKVRLREVALYRGDNGIAATPFFDSYHQHEIKTDAIVWKLDEDFVNIKMMSGAGKAPASFTSANYFRTGELEKFMGVMDFNPISTIFVYARDNDTREIYAVDLAKKMNPNYTESTIKGLLYQMVEEGFIYYDEDISTVTVKDKVFNYIKANVGLIDYDIIKINSFSPKLNGKIYFENQDIDLIGVKQVLLSDSQNVFIHPQGKALKLQRDQNMAFSGTVVAGRLDFKGEGFHFSYDSFQIDLTKLAFALIYVPDGKPDAYGKQKLVPMRSKIEGLTGYLEIDKPDNKSGKENYSEYPIFTNLDKSYVYYSDTLIHRGAYIRDSFYFELIPFVFDSLDTFDPYLSDFEGTLYSAGIFPNFEENLQIQKDLSLGFKRTTPADGYPIYGGKGQFNDTIFLSNKGLRGSGTVKYLFNTIESNDIIFFPDSMDAFAQSFAMEQTTYEDVTFPVVKGADNEIHWLPYLDSLGIAMTDKPFIMYEDSATLTGDLTFTKKGLKGNGDFEFNEASLSSNLFNFQATSLDSDTLDMVIKSIDADKVTFNTPNVSARVDFEKREGEFKSNESGIEMHFTNNQYKTAIDEFFWDMDANLLDFKAPPDSAVYFISTREDQDSLKFIAERAFFDMTASIIKVDSVRNLFIADAIIFPENKKVTILPGGLLDSLQHAEIIFDTVNSNHKIIDARIKINSKKDFEADGIYQYEVEGLNPYSIIMHEIGVKEEQVKKKTLYKTYANGMIDSAEVFSLHPRFKFKGLVNLESNRNNLLFDGFAKLNLNNQVISTNWFTMQEEISPDSVIIHYNRPANKSGDSLYTGIYFDLYDSVSSVYTSLFQPLNTSKDFHLYDAVGIVKYDADNESFIMGNADKINGKSMHGKVLTYDETTNTVFAEGKFDLGLQLEPVELLTSGTIRNNLDSGSYIFNTLVALDVPVEKELMEFFATDLVSFTFDRPDADYYNEHFEGSLAELFDEKKAKKVIDELRKTGQFVRQKDLPHNIILSNVKLVFEPAYMIYRSVGPLSISFIGEQGVHKQVKGYLELGYRKNNDFFNLYLESDLEDWYFMSYNNKTLQVLSSNKEYNKMLASMVPDDRKGNLGQDQFYFYTVNTYTKMQEFLYRMRQIEQGIKVVAPTLSEEEIFQEELERIKQELFEAQDLQSDSMSNVIVVGDEQEISIENDSLGVFEDIEDAVENKKKKKAKKAGELELFLQPGMNNIDSEQGEEPSNTEDEIEQEEAPKKKKKVKAEPEPKELELIPEEPTEGVSDFEMMGGDSKKKKKKKGKTPE